MGRSRQKKQPRQPADHEPPAYDASGGRIKGIRSYNAQDLDMTGQDLFELQQDSIGLEDESHMDSRQDDDEVFKSAEVLPLNIKRRREPSESEQSDSEDEQEAEDAASSQPARKKSRIPQEHQPAPARPGLTSRFNKPSQEQEEDQNQSSEASSAEESDSEPEEGWGNAYHVSRREVEQGPYQPRQKKPGKRNKDEEELELDPEQAELAEALRLQKIQRQHMDLEDFGSVAPILEATSSSTTANEADQQKSAPQLTFDTREAAIAHLSSTSPLLLSLLTDFQDQTQHASDLEAALRDISPAGPFRALQTLHLQAVQSYLAVLAFWLKLALQGQQETQLANSVFQKMVQLREGLQGLQDAGLDLDDPRGEDFVGLQEDSDEEEDFDDSASFDDTVMEDEKLQELVQQRDLLKMLEREGLSLEDLQQANEDEDTDDEEEESDEQTNHVEDAPAAVEKKKRNRKRKSKKQQAAQPTQPLLQLSTPEARDDFLEPVSLSSVDAGDKKSKKHTLRFHAAQVASTANRRSTAAEARRQGGDADVPYVSKEQLRREAQRKAAARQEKELRARGEMPDQQQDDAADLAQEGDDGYYDLVQSSKGAAKQAKKMAYDEQRMQDRAALAAEESTTGPRAASRAILANKGLTPRRPKANRNPRVKKRENYEKAKKRVGSQKRVYNAEAASKARAPGAYEGERSGINRRAVKSTKL